MKKVNPVKGSKAIKPTKIKGRKGR